MSRDRRHRVLWIEWTDEGAKEAQVRAYIRRDRRALGEIIGELINVAYRSEAEESDDLGRPGEVFPGLLTEEDWTGLVEELWPSQLGADGHSNSN
jgi:hypothetical protein